MQVTFKGNNYCTRNGNRPLDIPLSLIHISVAVEVTLEVYEFLDQADHKTENLSHEQRRHWDGRELDEYIVATEGVGIYGETPEDYLCRMETLDELMAVLDTCTEAQRRRFLLYALDLSLIHI